MARRNAKGQYVKHKKGRSKGKKKGSGLFGIHFRPWKGKDWKTLGKAKTWHKILHPKPPGYRALKSIADTVRRNPARIATKVITHGTPLAGPAFAINTGLAIKKHFDKAKKKKAFDKKKKEKGNGINWQGSWGTGGGKGHPPKGKGPRGKMLRGYDKHYVKR